MLKTALRVGRWLQGAHDTLAGLSRVAEQPQQQLDFARDPITSRERFTPARLGPSSVDLLG
jgi:hypothetical protein